MTDLQESLSEREIEILACLVEGVSNREIANRLHLAYQTVKGYNSDIYSKLGVTNRDSAIERATALGLLESASDTPQPTGKHNLPESVTEFVGRRQEINELVSLIESQRLVTILAPGGMGKTRLSMEVARTQIGGFSDGVYFVPLAPLSSPNDIVTTIAENIGFVLHGENPPAQQLVDFLKDRSMLLVLDNFEHLLEGTPLVTDIVRSAQSVKVLVTTRERLNLRGENVYSLRGLEFPKWETPEDALEYDAVKLFMQSANRVRSDFELHTDDLDFLARICRLTAGMPLGIELAAGWVDVLSLGKIADEIQQGIDILETDMRDVPERHRSLRATFERTWDRLTNDEQTVFARLSVFRGGFTLESVEAVASANARHLRKLAQKSLIQTEATERYTVHELLRQFGEGKLAETGAYDSLRQLHSTYYMEFMAKREADVQGQRQLVALAEIRTDFENIRLAWLWASNYLQADNIYSALDCLTIAFEMNNHLLEGQRLLFYTKSKLHQNSEGIPHPIWDAVTVRLGRYNCLLGQVPDGELIREILERNRIRNDKMEMAWCHWVLGDYSASRYDIESRNKHFKVFEDLHAQLGNEFYVGHTFVSAGTRLRLLNQLDRALDAFRESVSIRRRIGDWNSVPFSLYMVAAILIDSGRFDEGEAYLDEAFALEDQVGIVPILGHCYSLKARLAFWRGNLDIAHQYTEVALTITRQQSFIGSHSTTLANLSDLLLIEGRYQQAHQLAEKARSHVSNVWILKYTKWSYALANCGLENNDVARQAVLELLHISTSHTHSIIDAQLCLPIASVLFARAGQTHRAIELLGLAYSAPPELTGWLPHWKLLVELQDELQSKLGAEEFSAVWERGAKLDLDQVVKELITEFGDN